nr:MAG TPA: hypothetical protein [Caudoviricetes sp.]
MVSNKIVTKHCKRADFMRFCFYDAIKVVLVNE